MPTDMGHCNQLAGMRARYEMRIECVPPKHYCNGISFDFKFRLFGLNNADHEHVYIFVFTR